ncbi:MAG: hypothetical protein HY721_23050, partial [Planctomycetes bacterium]|nr:hypothetical protein [Planctomycetota bacterium]
MARRRSLLRDLTRAADAIGGAARRAARDRERALRRERAAAERQARALERLAKEEEREMALASAAQEHEENEALLAEIRDLLRKAPSRLRTREDHEAGLRRDPFPPPGRLEADRERLEAEVTARVAAARPPRHALLTFLTLAGGHLVLAGLALALAAPWAGLPCLALGLAQAFWAVRAAHGLEKAFVRAEEGRAREEASASIAEDLERDRAAHERREDERIARLRALLEGEARACAEAFQLAADRIDLPLDASAVLAMADPEVAELHVNLHAAEEVPLQRSTLLKSGRITYRNRPKREVGEDDARAIASLCLLHAAAAFDVAPTLDTIVLSAFRSGVDPATGHDADLCHASAIVEREAFGRLKLDRADPIAALRSFDPRFDCSASFLLKTVAPFRLADLEGDRDREGSDRGEEGVDRRGAGAGAGAAKALD